MNRNTCKICEDNYNENARVPKITTCGHVLCMDCLTTILQGTPKCPFCCVELSTKEVDHYITVFDLIDDNCQAAGNEPIDHFEIVRRTLQNNLSICQQKLLSIAREHETVTADILNSTSEIEKLIEELNRKQEKMEELQDLGENLVDQLERAVQMLKIHSQTRPTDEPQEPECNVSLCDFSSSKEYLNEIREQLQQGERVFAKHRRREEVFFAAVFFIEKGDCYSFDRRFPNRFIAVGSLTKTRVPAWGIVLTPFEDLKKLSSLHSTIFIEVEHEILNFESVSHLTWSRSVQQVLTLVTGEEGPCLAGGSLELSDGEATVTQSQHNGAQTPGCLPTMPFGVIAELRGGESMVLAGFDDGGFKLRLNRNCGDSPSKRVRGEGFSTSDLLQTESGRTITECGFLLECE